MQKIYSGYVNLLKTAIGSGILSYPFLFYSYGMLPITVLSLTACFFSFLGLVFYIICNNKQEGQRSIKSLATSIFPSASIIADSAMCLKCFGVAVSYLIIIRQLLPLILIYMFGNQFFTTPAIALLLFLLITSSFSYFRHLDKLKYTSICGLCCIFLVVLTTFYRIGNAAELKKEEMVLIAPLSVLWFTGLGKIVFSFTCHQNIFTVQNEVGTESTSRLILLSMYTMLTALIIYLIFGYSNYLLFGNSVKDNVLEMYPKDKLAVFVQGLYVLAMGFSYPLQINPCRLYLMELLNISSDKNEQSQIVYFLITTLLIVVTYSIAISGVQLGMVYSLIGATASSLMCLILPGFFYLRIVTDRRRSLTFLAYGSIILGILVFCSSGSNIFLK
ncbi:hypothetical protein COBT_000997 [Conglomerata obtusa]